MAVWGKLLYQAATAGKSSSNLLSDWLRVPDGTQGRFSIFVDSRLPEGSSDPDPAQADEAVADQAASDEAARAPPPGGHAVILYCPRPLEVSFPM
jgi:hypothetical protein